MDVLKSSLYSHSNKSKLAFSSVNIYPKQPDVFWTEDECNNNARLISRHFQDIGVGREQFNVIPTNVNQRRVIMVKHPENDLRHLEQIVIRNPDGIYNCFGQLIDRIDNYYFTDTAAEKIADIRQAEKTLAANLASQPSYDISVQYCDEGNFLAAGYSRQPLGSHVVQGISLRADEIERERALGKTDQALVPSNSPTAVDQTMAKPSNPIEEAKAGLARAEKGQDVRVRQNAPARHYYYDQKYLGPILLKDEGAITDDDTIMQVVGASLSGDVDPETGKDNPKLLGLYVRTQNSHKNGSISEDLSPGERKRIINRYTANSKQVPDSARSYFIERTVTNPKPDTPDEYFHGCTYLDANSLRELGSQGKYLGLELPARVVGSPEESQ